jgi:hypothetical protein
MKKYDKLHHFKHTIKKNLRRSVVSGEMNSVRPEVWIVWISKVEKTEIVSKCSDLRKHL